MDFRSSGDSRGDDRENEGKPWGLQGQSKADIKRTGGKIWYQSNVAKLFMTSQAANEEAVAKTAEVFKEGETNLAILIMYAPTNKRQMS